MRNLGEQFLPIRSLFHSTSMSGFCPEPMTAILPLHTAYSVADKPTFCAGISVCILTVSPRARGLFHQSSSHSGPCVGSWGPGPQADGYALSAQLMKQLGAPSVEAMRHVRAERLRWPSQDEIANFSFPGCYLDGWVLPPAEPGGKLRTPADFLLAGEVNVQRAIVGATSK